MTLKYRQSGNESCTPVSRHCLMETWNYLLSFPCALKCNQQVTSLSSRWLPMNFVSTRTDTQPSPTHQCPHSHISSSHISAEGNFKHKLRSQIGKDPFVCVCEEVERRERERKIREGGVYGLVLIFPNACCPEGKGHLA